MLVYAEPACVALSTEPYTIRHAHRTRMTEVLLLQLICNELIYLGLDAYDRTLLRCMFSIAFFALTRISEITASHHNITFQDTNYDGTDNSYVITFRSFNPFDRTF